MLYEDWLAAAIVFVTRSDSLPPLLVVAYFSKLFPREEKREWFEQSLSTYTVQLACPHSTCHSLGAISLFHEYICHKKVILQELITEEIHSCGHWAQPIFVGPFFYFERGFF